MKRFLQVVIGLGLMAAPASSAEKLSFQLGEFERSIPIDELADYAAGGSPRTALADVLRLFKPSEKQALRKALNQSAPVNAVMASNILSTAVGKRTIQQLVKLINQPTDVAGHALASALIEGAAKGDGLRLIDVLEAYPLPSIPVNVDAVGSLLRSLTQDFNLQNKLYSRLVALGGTPKAGPDLQVEAQSGSTGFEQVSFSFRGRVVDSIKAGVYLPKTAKATSQAPLVVLAPGLNTDMNALLYVGQTLASHGYAVASLDFPFTSADTMTAAIDGTGAIPPANAWYRQPLTVSELIDQVEKRWGNRVDTKRVGVLGQSLGGYTVTALAGAQLDWPNLVRGCEQLNDLSTVVLNPAIVWQCAAPGRVVKRTSFRDPRVKVAVAVNPVTNPIFSSRSMSRVAVPMLVIAGMKDIFAPPVSQQLTPFTGLRQHGSVLAVQKNGTHLSFLDATSNLPPVITGPAQSLARQELRGMAKLFFDKHLLKQAGTLLLAPVGNGAFQSGSAPLPLLFRSSLTMQQLKIVEPGLKEMP
jgi:predicted dienelactone hydrolase